MPKDYSYRMTRSCVECDKPMWEYRRSAGKPPPGDKPPRCRACTSGSTRANRTQRARQSYPDSTCAKCGVKFKPWKPNRPGKFCSRSCAARAKGAVSSEPRPVDAPAKVRRADRAVVAPGLRSRAQVELRRSWERQGRTCHYCGGAPETVDHVVPLVRGGTNHEGNLVPACRKCNASKCDLLLVEWRYGKPRGSDGPLREWMSHPRWVKGRKAVTSCQHEPAPAAA